MGAILQRIDDPRDDLLKMTRDELYAYGKAHGVEFPQGRDTPAFDMTGRTTGMVDILRALGLRGPNMASRVLGSPAPMEPPVYSNQIIPKAPPPPPPAELPADVRDMTMGQLRKECKQRGVKIARTDNMNTLREKLRG